MPVYNGERFLAQAIESILAQTFADFEFIIVDDGSRDRSAEIIRSYEARDERIRFLRLERNAGESATRNHGIDAATGAYIAAMDCDDVSLPGRLEKQVNFLRANPEIGALGTSASLTDEDLKPYYTYAVPERHAHIAYNILLGRSVVGASLMIRRDILNAVGGYDPSRKRCCDIELISRLLCETGVANLPDSLYLYRMHDGQWGSTPKGRRYWAELKSRLLFRLWAEAPQASLDRIVRVRGLEKINWLERRRVKRDIRRLIDSMIAAKWVTPDDRDFLFEVMNRQLERTSPRLWQMFCHWRRHHFGGNDRKVEYH